MKRQRTTLHVAEYFRRHLDAQALTVTSVQVGDWHAHKYNGDDQELGEGIVVAHKSGIATTWRGLRPAQAVRLLRLFQTLPPCPVGDDELIERIRARKTREAPGLIEWLDRAKSLTESVMYK